MLSRGWARDRRSPVTTEKGSVSYYRGGWMKRSCARGGSLPTRFRRSSRKATVRRRRRSYRRPSSSRTVLGPNILAEGIVITPSHNPPEDGGFKYNPPHGGPAHIDVTQSLETQPTKSWQPEQSGRADRVRVSARCVHDPSARLDTALCQGPAERGRYGGHCTGAQQHLECGRAIDALRRRPQARRRPQRITPT